LPSFQVLCKSAPLYLRNLFARFLATRCNTGSSFFHVHASVSGYCQQRQHGTNFVGTSFARPPLPHTLGDLSVCMSVSPSVCSAFMSVSLCSHNLSAKYELPLFAGSGCVGCIAILSLLRYPVKGRARQEGCGDR
jgi:hypothetical protein